MHPDDELRATGPRTLDLEAAFDAMAEEVARFRRAVLKQGHAQELFQQRLEQEIRRLAGRVEAMAPASSPPLAAAPPARAAGAEPNSAQQRALLDLDQAVLHLLLLARGAASPTSSHASNPRTVQEGLSLLQIRVRNLQRSFGLEPIPAAGLPFDDRSHQAAGVCDRSDLADGQVAEELLPGYRLRGRLLRPALVTVNRRGTPGGAED